MALTERFLNARRRIIRRQFSTLNDAQQEAVLHTQGPVLLLAGAGSGKTTVLVQRVANLLRFGSGSQSETIPTYISDSDVARMEGYLQGTERLNEQELIRLCRWDAPNPWNVLAITFTNKAANELKIRLRELIGPEAEDIWAMTFHSACCRILRRNINRLGYTSSFTIYDTADSERVMKQVLRDLQLDDKQFPPKMFLNLISASKDKLQFPDDYAKQAAGSGDFRIEQAAKAYTLYAQYLKNANALDFDDLILLTVKLLQQDEEVRGYYQQKFRYVLVDEYQDTNHLQYLLTKLLAGGYENICVVGDDDQSIYRFRGATIENILSFEKQYPSTRLIRLEQNYRSTRTILNAANAVIANNHGRKGKTLWTQNAEGEKIRVYEASNETDEAENIARIIARRKPGEGFGSYAILYRTNVQSNALEQMCKRHEIPYRIIGGMRFFDRAEVKDMLAYLCVIQNPADDLRLERIINRPLRAIGQKTLEVVQRLAASAETSLFSVISNAHQYPALSKAEEKLNRFASLIQELQALLPTLTLPEFYEELLLRSGYMAMLQEKPTPENQNRLDNIRELKSSVITYVQSTDTPTLGGFLEQIALYTDIEKYDPNADALVMMTVHSAKGLEFDHVFLVGMEEGLFPSTWSGADSKELEEERRLCYVAITRAKKTLNLSYAVQRMLYGRTSYNRPSRFLDELPQELVLEERGVAAATSMPQSAYAVKQPLVHRQQQPLQAPTAPSYQKGERVEHDAFGKGMILTALPMGNDMFLEIAFDSTGTRKLMANTASKHMKKL